MPRVFVDATGTDPKEHSLNLAGWVASVGEWERFSDAWFVELQKKPAITYFKHYEAKSQTGEFAGWSPIACDQKILALARVIAKHDVYGVITGIRHAVMTELFKRLALPIKTARSVLHVHGSYDWCFHSIIAIVLQYEVNLGKGEVVDFIFDKDDKGAFENCSSVYRTMRDDKWFPAAMLAIAGTVVPGDDKKLMPLQASDLLAGQATVKLRGRNAMEEPYKVLAREKRILFSPIRWGDPLLANFAESIQLLNVIWSSKQLERAKERNER